MPDRAGRIVMVTSFLVECARCGHRIVFDGCHRSDVPAEARAVGWKLTKKDGWVCPDCLNSNSP